MNDLVTVQSPSMPLLDGCSLVPSRAACIDRRADLALSEGRHDVAERLSTLAAELRERLAPQVLS